jgi:hypothetical protein
MARGGDEPPRLLFQSMIRKKPAPGLDPGWEPVFRKDHARLKSWDAIVSTKAIALQGRDRAKSLQKQQ